MNRDAGLELRETFCLCLSRLKPRVPIHLHFPDPPRITVFNFANYQPGRLLWDIRFRLKDNKAIYTAASVTHVGQGH